MARAMDEVAASDNLRFFMRSLLAQCGWLSTPVAATPEATFKLCGRHEIGVEVINVILERKPELLTTLIQEDLHENRNEQN